MRIALESSGHAQHVAVGVAFRRRGDNAHAGDGELAAFGGHLDRFDVGVADVEADDGAAFGAARFGLFGSFAFARLGRDRSRARQRR